MKKLLLIIPLLIWVACEDEDNESDSLEDDFQFVNEWVACKRISTTELSEDGQVLDEYIINWNGNIATYSTGVIEHYNEYGLATKFIAADSSFSFIWNYIDKWKFISQYSLDENGDTTDAIDNIEWNGLVYKKYNNAYGHEKSDSSTVVYNEFGRVLINEYRSPEVTEYSYTEYEYMEDQRRELFRRTSSSYGGELFIKSESTWNGNVCNRKNYNNDGTLDTQYEITYNEYYQMISRIMYDGNGNFIYSFTYEYECPGFEQIYP